MRFLLVSDNHGRREVLDELIKMYPDQDYYLHAGDSELPPEYLKQYQAVTGNNDYFYDYPNHLIISENEVRILLIHGHQYFMMNRLNELVKLAQELKCQVVCFGHTHCPFQKEIDGILALNPGSLRYNRDGSAPSYMLVDFKSIHDYQVEVKRY